MSTLKTYIKLVVEQQLNEIYSKTFDLNKFKTIDISPDENEIKLYWKLTEYAQNTLKFLGIGSARQVFLLSSSKCLKIAINEKGVAQNKIEVNLYTKTKHKNILAKIYDCDKKYNWVISELVRPINSQEFKTLTHCYITTIVYAALALIKNKPIQFGFDNEQDVETQMPMIKDLSGIIKAHDLMYQEFDKEHAWGKTSDGRIVLLDYGITNKVYDKYYATNYE